MGAKIGILGAGLAGLSAAHSLGNACELFEREGAAGGLCRSRHVGAYVFDYGPHVFYTKSRFVKRLVGSALKKAGNNRLAGKPRRAYIYLGGTYVKYPFEANLRPLPDAIKKECVEGARNRKAPESGSFLGWINSTFGDGIGRHYMRPYNEKIWKYPLSKMNTDWIAGRVPAPSLGDIVRSASWGKNGGREFGGNKYFYYPLRDGTGAIPAALSAGMSNISYGFEAKKIRTTKNGIEVGFQNGRKRDFSKIISTLPLPELVSRLDDVPSRVVRAAGRLIHNSSVCVNLGVDRQRISDKHWLYFPEKKYVFNRISFPGNFSPNTVPEGKSSVLTEVTYRSRDNIPPKPKGYYVSRVVEGLRDAGILRESDVPEAVDVAVLKYAYVVYDLSHRKNTKLIRDWLEGIGIFTSGRFGEWEYLNMDGAILSGRRVSQQLKQA